MIKRGLILLLFFQFQFVLGQKTLEQIINETPFIESYYSPFSYSDNAWEKQGVSIQNETQILKTLKLEPLEYGEYYITGKYEINNLIVLFFSKYWDSEDVHFAILLDKSLKIIDRLDETAYSNDEGFYGVTSYIDYNIITTTRYNIYNNPEYVRKKYTITNKGFKAIKDQVVIKTPSGVRIRNKPTTHSAVVASVPNLEVFNYLSHDNKIDSTTVFDNGKNLKNYWLEISEKDSLQQLGYVFGAFAKRTIAVTSNDYKIILDEISKEDFDLEEMKIKSSASVEKITDIQSIKKILKNQLIGEYHDDGYYIIKKIRADNGKEINAYLDECGITAYYPKYHYLLLECGHASDYLINLKNGEDDVNRIGNPDYYASSPGNTFRLNGYYSGQSNVHFLEKNNKNASPEYLFSMSSLIPLDYMEKYFWKDNTTILVKIEKMYYKIQLHKL
ncbi:MAG: SH3 domain-containing protein [Xanthomarina sp.]